MIKTVTKDTYLKSILIILKNCKKDTVIYQSYPKKLKKNEKKSYVIQALDHGLILEIFHKLIDINQRVWIKPHINMNTQISTRAKSDFEKELLKPMSNSVFRKTMVSARMHSHIKLVTTNRRRSHLVTEPKYQSTKWFSQDLLEIEMNKTEVKVYKLEYLGLSIVDISKIAMYEY